MALTTHTLDAVRDGHYTLLLGSGASLGALSRDGRQLPTSSAFAQELVGGLALDVAPETPLAYVWDAAVHRCGSEEAVRRRFCVPRFLGCKPTAYHDLIPTFAWKRIYTFNVDDVLPTSYKRASEPLQSPLPLHFDHDYKEADPHLGRVPDCISSRIRAFSRPAVSLRPACLCGGGHATTYLVACLRLRLSMRALYSHWGVAPGT